MSKKNKPKPKVEEPLPVVEERPPVVEKKTKEPVIWPVNNDDVRKEVDDLEHILRMVNIKYGSKKVREIAKIIVYEPKTKKVVKAFYRIEEE